MCTFDTDKIYLTWKKDTLSKRHIIGVLTRDDNQYFFKYLPGNLAIAQQSGFSYYPAFDNTKKVYKENVIDVFARRLLNPARRDYDDFLKYWGAENYKDDIFAILGLTGAKLLTDNFEFIAPHQEYPASFNTNISWINVDSEQVVNSIKQLPIEVINQKIMLLPEPENEFDSNAVKVLFDNDKLGYIKSIHCKNIFDAIAAGYKVKHKVANIIKNGTIREILLKINIE